MIGSINFRQLTDGSAHDQAAQHTPKAVHGTQHKVAQHPGCKDHQRRCRIFAPVQGALRVSAVLGPYKECGDHGTENAYAAQHQREDSRIQPTADGCSCKCQGDGRDNGANIAFKQIGTHTGYIAHIVAHIVCNGCRVAGIVLRNTGLHFAHQISAHVRSLGINTAADTGKQSDRRRTQTKACENIQSRGIAHKIVLTVQEQED